ncbi:12675_t:CDS:2 [Acaulospora morrowiae]|uniref:12675_t:CDS:1 n=1 Tax=Acaulospora morrowiae TaxID=94023 RepID=A0A9N9E584_9GLOM|nr:12675_t:CDS:2 [Acaulospora morrowiae]
MSSATIARDIPAIKKADPGSSLPRGYSTTPSGTIYSSTPGGTRIIYDRSTLLNLANSPLSKTSPSNLAYVPGVTIPHHHNDAKPNSSTTNQVAGHLAPPQPHPELKKTDLSGKTTTGAESGDEDSNQAFVDHKEVHNEGVFDMEME